MKFVTGHTRDGTTPAGQAQVRCCGREACSHALLVCMTSSRRGRRPRVTVAGSEHASRRARRMHLRQSGKQGARASAKPGGVPVFDCAGASHRWRPLCAVRRAQCSRRCIRPPRWRRRPRPCMDRVARHPRCREVCSRDCQCVDTAPRRSPAKPAEQGEGGPGLAWSRRSTRVLESLLTHPEEDADDPVGEVGPEDAPLVRLVRVVDVGEQLHCRGWWWCRGLLECCGRSEGQVGWVN